MASFASQAPKTNHNPPHNPPHNNTNHPHHIVYVFFQRQLQGSVSQGTNK
jgi:hypothetical protein